MSPKGNQNQICCYFSILHNLNPKNTKCQMSKVGKWESLFMNSLEKNVKRISANCVHSAKFALWKES